jgi:hypothetical protein
MKTVITITRKFDERDNCIDEVKTYQELKEEANPKYTEVKRVAKVGEWIKIVDSSHSVAKNGDILEVSGVGSMYVRVLNSNHTNGGFAECTPDYEWLYAHSEYVVLEGYKGV